MCKRSERHFDDDEISLLSGLAAHAAIAIDNTATLDRERATAHRLETANQKLERSLTWHQRLTNVVLHGGGVDDLLTEIASATNGTVELLDAQAHADCEIPERFPDLTEVFESPERAPTANTPTISEDGTALASTIVADRELLGTLLLTGTTVPDGDRMLLERAAPAVALAISKERAVAEATRLTRNSLLLDLLTRPATDALSLRQRMHNAGLTPAGSYCIVAIEPDNGPTTERRDAVLHR